MTISTFQQVKYLPTSALFIGGALITSIFSGSLANLTTKASFSEVLLNGMVVPSFTWLVQLGASWIGLHGLSRQEYWRDLGWICLIGSVALLPAALVNLALLHPPLWISAANVLLSVAIMAATLFRFSVAKRCALGWPISWCLTIAANMALFAWVSSGWW